MRLTKSRRLPKSKSRRLTKSRRLSKSRRLNKQSAKKTIGRKSRKNYKKTRRGGGMTCIEIKTRIDELIAKNVELTQEISDIQWSVRDEKNLTITDLDNIDRLVEEIKTNTKEQQKLQTEYNKCVQTIRSQEPAESAESAESDESEA